MLSGCRVPAASNTCLKRSTGRSAKPAVDALIGMVIVVAIALVLLRGASSLARWAIGARCDDADLRLPSDRHRRPVPFDRDQRLLWTCPRLVAALHPCEPDIRPARSP